MSGENTDVSTFFLRCAHYINELAQKLSTLLAFDTRKYGEKSNSVVCVPLFSVVRCECLNH